MPATGSLMAPIEIATGKKAYFVGKPNPLMLRHGLKKLDLHSSEIAFIGEYGTKKVRARPFMREAVEATAEQAEQAALQVYDRWLKSKNL